MAFNLRLRRPQCFYCGKRSAQKISVDARQFECERCLAVNHLDENGEITDPPALNCDSPVQSSIRYARSQSRSPPPGAGNVFCDVCLKNQYLYKENLALYLPDARDPKYREYVASLPTYKAKLEERYPQVCSDCAPRAREKIKQAGYIAKTDHLRRMMAQTRSGSVSLRAGAWWRLWVIRLGGLGWWSSATLQTLWHLLGAIAQSHKDAARDYASKNAKTYSLAPICARQAWQTHKVDSPCVERSSAYIPFLLVLSIFTVWWNPHLSNKYLRQRKGRMKGLADYSIQCAVLLIFRAGAWFILRDPRTMTMDSDIYKAGHIFMIVFTVFSMIYGLTLVKLDTNPVVSFHVPDDQILPGIPERDQSLPPRVPSLRLEQQSLFGRAPVAPRIAQQAQATTQKQIPYASVAEQRADFRPRAAPLRPEASNSLFAAVSEPAVNGPSSDPDAMDWSPSRNVKTFPASNLRPRVPLQDQQPAFGSGPSPFQSRVPAGPPNRMRHPNEQVIQSPGPAFKKASEEQKRTFFSGITDKRNQKLQNSRAGHLDGWGTASTVDDAVEGVGLNFDMASSSAAPRASEIGMAATTTGAGTAGDFKMAPQRLFLKSDQRDTGLESMFDEVFSFRDEPSTTGITDTTPSTFPEPQTQNLNTRGNGVFGLDSRGQVVRDRVEQVPQSGLLSALLLGLLPAIILGMVAVAVKLFRSRTGDVLHEL